MRKVLFKRRDVFNGKNWTYGDFTNPGTFHQWANGYEEFESGPGNYSYAIIELEDGTIEEVLPSNIKFVD